LRFILLEEVHEVALVRLQRDLIRKSGNTELLDNFEDIELLIELTSRIFEQVVFPLPLRPAAATDSVVEPME